MKTDLRRDDRGAVLLIGMFSAPLLVGAIYYVVSIAEAIHQREALQVAADAGAMATVVVEARAMNAIAVINWLMVAITTVTIPTRALLPAYALVASLPCADPCSCKIVMDAKRAHKELKQRSDRLEERAKTLLEALDQAQKSLAKDGPEAGEESARKNMQSRTQELPSGASMDIHGSSLSPQSCRYGLPVEDDKFEQVCKRAKPWVDEFAFRIAKETLDSIGQCKSGALALAIASSDLQNPTGRVCKEKKNAPCSGSGPHPKKVFKDAKNGNDWMQVWSEVKGTLDDRGRKGVEFGAPQAEPGKDPKSDFGLGFAQAEIFFDCSGGWSSCNGNDEKAMWDTKWRARMRRVHKPEISWGSESRVKNELASADHWSGLRRPLVNQRKPRPWADAPLAATLRSEEGPTQ